MRLTEHFTEDTVRHLTTILLSALICVIGAASTAGAQVTSDSTMRSQRESPIGRWITRPTTITLTADQWKKFDSASAKYAAESRQLRDRAKSQQDMGMVFRMRDMTHKYQNMVRAALSPAQQAIFDKNVQADTCCQ